MPIRSFDSEDEMLAAAERETMDAGYFVVRIFVTDHEEFISDFWEEWGEFQTLTAASDACRDLKSKGIECEICRYEDFK